MGHHDKYRFLKVIDAPDLHQSRDRFLAFPKQITSFGKTERWFG